MGRSTNIYSSLFNHAAPNTNMYVFVSDLKSGIVTLACSNVAARKKNQLMGKYNRYTWFVLMGF
jgi:hypothetical protein